MPRNLATSALIKPLVVLALPGMYLYYKYNQYKRQQQEQTRRKVTERELAHLNHKIVRIIKKDNVRITFFLRLFWSKYNQVYGRVKIWEAQKCQTYNLFSILYCKIIGCSS